LKQSKIIIYIATLLMTLVSGHVHVLIFVHTFIDQFLNWFL